MVAGGRFRGKVRTGSVMLELDHLVEPAEACAAAVDVIHHMGRSVPQKEDPVLQVADHAHGVQAVHQPVVLRLGKSLQIGDQRLGRAGPGQIRPKSVMEGQKGFHGGAQRLKPLRRGLPGGLLLVQQFQIGVQSGLNAPPGLQQSAPAGAEPFQQAEEQRLRLGLHLLIRVQVVIKALRVGALIPVMLEEGALARLAAHHQRELHLGPKHPQVRPVQRDAGAGADKADAPGAYRQMLEQVQDLAGEPEPVGVGGGHGQKPGHGPGKGRLSAFQQTPGQPGGLNGGRGAQQRARLGQAQKAAEVVAVEVGDQQVGGQIVVDGAPDGRVGKARFSLCRAGAPVVASAVHDQPPSLRLQEGAIPKFDPFQPQLHMLHLPFAKSIPQTREKENTTRAGRLLLTSGPAEGKRIQ